jgi:uncharacterized protein YggE
MTSNDQPVLLSVRGDAQRTVAPDQASFSCGVAVLADSKEAARADAAASLRQLTDALTELGGRPLTTDATQAPLTWSAYSVQTHPDHGYDKRTGEHGPTGRHRAIVRVRVLVRDFSLVARVEALLGQVTHAELHSVNWSVDDDNAAWAQVRADAIHAALAKGRDYAAALGGSVVAVQQIADGGLLDGSPSQERLLSARAASGSVGGGEDGIALDPAPQVVSAVIDARLSAVIATPAG